MTAPLMLEPARPIGAGATDAAAAEFGTGTGVHPGLVAATFGGAVVLRLLLAFVIFPGAGHAGDLGFFTSWASTLAANGPGTFYATANSANYPPGYMLVLWLVGAISGPVGAISGLSPDRALLLLIKVPAMAADVAIGGLLWRAGRRWFGERVGLVAAALWLFAPVSWYDSAIWGQVDAVGALFVLGSIILLVDRRSEASLVVAVLGALIKPQALIALVVVVPVLLRRHLLVRDADGVRGGIDGGAARLGRSLVLGGVALIVPLLPFDIARLAPSSLADVPVIGHIAGLLGLFASVSGQYAVLTANAFNAWSLVGANSTAVAGVSGQSGWVADSMLLFGVPASTIGTALLVVVGLLVSGGLFLRRADRLAILLGICVVAFAFYAVPTRVHERYLVPFFAPAALLLVVGAARIAAGVAGYLGLAGLNFVNLHAVLVGGGGSGGALPSFTGGGRGGFGGAGAPGARGSFGGAGGGSGALSVSLPLGDLSANPAVITAVSIGQTVAFVALLGAWVVLLARPVPDEASAIAS